MADSRFTQKIVQVYRGEAPAQFTGNQNTQFVVELTRNGTGIIRFTQILVEAFREINQFPPTPPQVKLVFIPFVDGVNSNSQEFTIY